MDFIRHTAASHLLEVGVDINTIRAWHGHVSVDTTSIYAEVNMRMKADAIKTCSIDNGSKVIKRWKSDKGFMDFLQSLKYKSIRNTTYVMRAIDNHLNESILHQNANIIFLPT